MDLENIQFELGDLPESQWEEVKKELDEFPLTGGANYPTLMRVRKGTKKHLELSPRTEKQNLRFEFELQSLPSNYFISYSFGGSNYPPAILISEMSSLNGGKSHVKRTYKIFSRPLN